LGLAEAIPISALLLALGVSDAACSAHAPSSGAVRGTTAMAGPGTDPSDDTGTIGFQLQLGPGITLSSVQYLITTPTLAGFAPLSGSVDVSGSLSAGFSICLFSRICG
jgi:hypothetical protein